MSIYITNAGDTFDSISYSLFGSEEFMARLIEANPEYAGTIRFDYGVSLEIPEVDTTTETALPSWRKKHE